MAGCEIITHSSVLYRCSVRFLSAQRAPSSPGLPGAIEAAPSMKVQGSSASKVRSVCPSHGQSIITKSTCYYQMQQDIEAARNLSSDILNRNPGPTQEIYPVQKHPDQGATHYAPEISSLQGATQYAPSISSLSLSLSPYYSLGGDKNPGRLKCCRAFQGSSKAD